MTDRRGRAARRSSAPLAAVDIVHQDVTLRGRALFQPDRESAPRPAPNAPGD
ncbi:hypothetical protein [Actinomadura chibensis]|uniref:hypothetical protein n=1 Tax=Actinomadura chibensis TaxID=392828 RepID=UPI000AD53EFE|nr:hypothetical protein [Actinomadura chibensis]